MTNVEDVDTPASVNALQRIGVQKVFIAGPFFKLVDPETGRMAPAEQQRIENLINHFEARGCTVFNAHKREQWGQAFLEPDVFTKLDFDEISEADLFVAIPGSPASLGTHVEIGWASAMQKPIILLLEDGKDYAGLVTGIGSVVATEILTLNNGEVPADELDVVAARVVESSRTVTR